MLCVFHHTDGYFIDYWFFVLGGRFCLLIPVRTENNGATKSNAPVFFICEWCFHRVSSPPLYFAEEDSETTLDFCLPPINYRIQNILLSPHRRNLPRCLQWRSYCLWLAKNLIFNRFLHRICNWNRRRIHSPTNQLLGAAKSASGGTVYKRKNMEYNYFNPASSGK